MCDSPGNWIVVAFLVICGIAALCLIVALLMEGLFRTYCRVTGREDMINTPGKQCRVSKKEGEE